MKATKHRQIAGRNGQMDETDKRLIECLRQNARMPMADLARAVGLARTTVQARIDRLEARGVIAGYSVRLGTTARPALQATVLLQIEPRAQANVVQQLSRLTEIETIHTTSGRFDMIVQVGADTSDALDTLIDQIVAVRGVVRSESLIHLSTKRDRMV